MPIRTQADRFGLPLTTTSAEAVEGYVAAIDRQLSLNVGVVERLEAAVQADPRFAIGHADLAYALWYRMRPEEARPIVAHAVALADGVSRRERRHIACVDAFVNGRTREAFRLIGEHLAEYPRDALVVVLGTTIINGSGRVGRAREALDFVSVVAPAYGDDWWIMGAQAFVHHEANLLAESRRFAERSLSLNPNNANGAHSMAHVFFESNDSGDGSDFLGEWLPTRYDSAAPLYGHLNWHLALFELARGDAARAVAIYHSSISPRANLARNTLMDSASLLWRHQLFDCGERDLPWGEVCAYAAKTTATLGMAFADAHAALAYAGAGDRTALHTLIDGLGKAGAAGNELAESVTLPLARGLERFAEGDYRGAAAEIGPLAGSFERIGGSHAQWEVFEDTLVQSYLRAEMLDRAEALLRKRLQRRASSRDLAWLERAAAPAPHA